MRALLIQFLHHHRIFAGGSNPALGDSLVIIGATLYALSNVSEVTTL